MPSAIELPLTTGGFTLIDPEDYEWAKDWKWFLNNTGYVCRTQHPEHRAVFLHRLIDKTPEGLKTDHINGNPKDNRRCNLRHVNWHQSAWNTSQHGKHSSQFKGVHLIRRPGRNPKWCSQITVNGEVRSLGYFVDEKEAARAYDRAAKRFFGEYARLNLPDEPEKPFHPYNDEASYRAALERSRKHTNRTGKSLVP